MLAPGFVFEPLPLPFGGLQFQRRLERWPVVFGVQRLRRTVLRAAVRSGLCLARARFFQSFGKIFPILWRHFAVVYGDTSRGRSRSNRDPFMATLRERVGDA